MIFLYNYMKLFTLQHIQSKKVSQILRTGSERTKRNLEKDRRLQISVKMGLTQTKAKRRQSGVFETLKAK